MREHRKGKGGSERAGVFFKVTQQVNAIPNLCLSLFGSFDSFLGQGWLGSPAGHIQGPPYLPAAVPFLTTGHSLQGSGYWKDLKK